MYAQVTTIELKVKLNLLKLPLMINLERLDYTADRAPWSNHKGDPP